MKRMLDIKDIEENYDLEIDRIVETINKQKAKKVLLQFPDGLKPYANAVAEEIEKKLREKNYQKEIRNIEIMIWFGSCYGACDVPLDVQRIGVDLIVQFGHSEWNNKN